MILKFRVVWYASGIVPNRNLPLQITLADKKIVHSFHSYCCIKTLSVSVTNQSMDYFLNSLRCLYIFQLLSDFSDFSCYKHADRLQLAIAETPARLLV